MPRCPNCLRTGKQSFCNLSPEARIFLDSNAIRMEYPRGSILFREGSHCNAIYILCSGRVKVTATSAEGRTVILRVVSNGGVLGMSAALGGGLHEVTAEAMERCRIRVLHTGRLTHFLSQYRDASMAAARALAADYRAAFQEVRRIALPETPAGRIARLLLDWAEEDRHTPASTITMPLTHEELASMTATTRETVTRTLSRFRKEKMIATNGIALTILQPSALHNLCSC